MYDLNKIDVAILCGGLGKRLRPTIGESPKVMAQVNGQPFLDLVLDYLYGQGSRRVILLTGYKAEVIEQYYRQNSRQLTIEFSREMKPLGTGGALKQAQGLIKSDPFILMNGDSFCKLDYRAFLDFHFQK